MSPRDSIVAGVKHDKLGNPDDRESLRRVTQRSDIQDKASGPQIQPAGL